MICEDVSRDIVTESLSCLKLTVSQDLFSRLISALKTKHPATNKSLDIRYHGQTSQFGNATVDTSTHRIQKMKIKKNNLKRNLSRKMVKMFVIITVKSVILMTFIIDCVESHNKKNTDNRMDIWTF